MKLGSLKENSNHYFWKDLRTRGSDIVEDMLSFFSVSSVPHQTLFPTADPEDQKR